MTDINTDVSKWTDLDRKAFFRSLGLKLERSANEGFQPDIRLAVYELAEDLVGTGQPSISLGDDILNDDRTNDAYYDLQTEPLIWMRWPDGLGFSTGLTGLDFGSGKWFTAEPPNGDLGTSWVILGVVDPADDDALHDQILNFIADRGYLPDELTISRRVPRKTLAEAVEAVLDAGWTGVDWEDLERWLEEREGKEAELRDASRSALVDRYLDLALRE